MFIPGFSSHATFSLRRTYQKIPEWTFFAMCCNTFLLFLILLEIGHLETPTLVYDGKNARLSKPLGFRHEMWDLALLVCEIE